MTTQELLEAGIEHNTPRVRELIILAEDHAFSPEESRELAPWLLRYAERYRESDDPQDAGVVWSAIRTGASMLTPAEANQLRGLLEPGYPIETSLVAVKMLGRIFEAQPPAAVDEHPMLAGKVQEMADALLNRHVIPQSECAAKAVLAVYALAAMASSTIEPTVQRVKELRIDWFTRRTRRKLHDLHSTWRQRPAPVADAPLRLLESALRMLDEV
ncbi:MAG: hypothetical protein ACLFTT_06770 [Candidatus Hydrogenedentota bacterium]